MPNPVTFPLRGGLDLLSAPLVVTPGSLVDCLNYEVSVREGYRRIDGYQRFDGQKNITTTNVYIKRFVDDGDITFPLGANPAETAGTFIFLVEFLIKDMFGNVDAHAGECRIGIVHGIDDSDNGDGTYKRTLYCTFPAHVDDNNGRGGGGGHQPPIDPLWRHAAGTILFATESDALDWYESDQGHSYYGPGGTEITGIIRIDSSVSGAIWWDNGGGGEAVSTLSGSASDQHFVATLAYKTLRAITQQAPGQGKVHGLFWFRNSLFAIRDMLTIPFTSGSEMPSLGDVITQGSLPITFTGIVVESRVTSGKWSDGTAAGTIMFSAYDGSPTTSTVITNTTTSTADIGTTGSAFDEQSHGAGIYKAIGTTSGTGITANHWQHQDLGYTVKFKNGLFEFKNRDVVSDDAITADDILTTSWKVPNASGASGGIGWGTFGAATYHECVDDGSTADFESTIIYNRGNAVGNNDGSNGFVSFNDFQIDDSDVPDGALVTGVEFEIIRRAYTTSGETATVKDNRVRALYESGAATVFGNNAAIDVAWSTSGSSPDQGAYETIQYGGEQNVMGLAGLSPDDVRSSSFGVELGAKVTAYSGGTSGQDYAEFRITSVRARVHYIPPGDMIYFWDGSAIKGVAHIINSLKESGDYDTSDAKGIIYIHDETDVTDAAGGMEIRSHPGPNTTPDGGSADGSTLLAKLDGRPITTMLESSATLGSNKYEVVSSNFYARRDLDAAYGVNGVGPAFMFDGTYFCRIHTGLPQENEKPNHVAAHQGHLFLGYSFGTGSASSTGSPLVFDATTGAFEVGFGSPVTGMYSLNGDALAVFTDKNVQMIQGDIGAGAYQSVISPSIGAIPWSCQSMGQFLFLSNTGIQTLQSVEAYGDYRPAALSAPVWPWLRDRVQTPTSVATGATSLVGSLAVRNKGQYRLLFADGYQLTATFMLDGPQFTIQQYTDNAGDAVAWFTSCYGTDANGRDRLFAASSANDGYVYELDIGPNFDDSTIDAHVVLSVADTQSPWQWKRYTDIAVFGQAQDYAGFNMYRSGNYDAIDSTNAIECRFGDPNGTVVTGELNAYASFNEVQIEGRSINIKLETSSKITPPHIFQAITLETSGLGKKRG